MRISDKSIPLVYTLPTYLWCTKSIKSIQCYRSLKIIKSLSDRVFLLWKFIGKLHYITTTFNVFNKKIASFNSTCVNLPKVFGCNFQCISCTFKIDQSLLLSNEIQTMQLRNFIFIAIAWWNNYATIMSHWPKKTNKCGDTFRHI